MATSSCCGHVDELATEPFLLLHREHGTGCRRSWNCCDWLTRFVVIWKHFCFIPSTGTRTRIDSVMRHRSSSASVTVNSYILSGLRFVEFASQWMAYFSSLPASIRNTWQCYLSLLSSILGSSFFAVLSSFFMRVFCQSTAINNTPFQSSDNRITLNRSEQLCTHGILLETAVLPRKKCVNYARYFVKFRCSARQILLFIPW